jgi:hypothetical protein
MEYQADFERTFMRRTLEILRTYEGAHDATMLVNCLLGLLIVPKERSLDRIPEDPLPSLGTWGISPQSIRRFGKCQCGHAHPEDLRQLVKSMRNAVAHFRIKPQHANGKCTGFEFKDQSGFHAVVSLEEMNAFARRLAEHLEATASASSPKQRARKKDREVPSP